jgi:small subunit ribosomal protein S8
MHTDPIADYLTRLRNGIRAGHDDVEIPASKLKMEISRILKEQGYITDFHKKPAAIGEAISVSLKYTEDRQPVILGIERVSRPGRRRYVDHKSVPRVQGGTGTAIVSTSVGVMTGHDARRKGVGGEVVAYVW